MSLDILKKTLLEVPVVKKGDYFYVVHPITDGVPDIKPNLLEEIIDELKRLLEEIDGGFDKIVTMEAMGIPLASPLSLRMNIPFVIIRKKSYGLPGEIDVEQETGYSKSKMYINGLKKGDEVVIVDDVLSTGGTLKAVLSVFEKIGVVVKKVFIVIDKGCVAQKISDEFKIPIKALVNIDVVNGKVVIKKVGKTISC